MKNSAKSSKIEKLTSLKNLDNILVCDSFKVTKKVVESKKFKPLEIYYEEGIDIPEKLLNEFPSINTLTKEELSQIKGRHFHKGIISIFEDYETKTISSFDNIKSPFVILNGVTSPENVGAIIRTIAGLNFKTLIFDEKTINPHNRRVARVSMGNFVYLDILKCENLEEAIKSSNLKVFATANDTDSINFKEWQPEQESGFVIGSEGHGIDLNIKTACHETIRIPINEKVQHLNAGHACAIISSKYLFS